LSVLDSTKALGSETTVGELQAYFALIVAILTSLDTWLKPGAKYRTHYEYDDEYRRLQNQILLLKPDDISKIESLRAELERVRERYRKALFQVAG
jgi:hypothetical protein